MKIKPVLGSITFLSAMAVVIIVTPREPKRDGRTLSSWLEDLDYTQKGYDPSKVPKAEDAVRHIGARGVPTLITMMQSPDSFYRESLRIRFSRFIAKQKIIRLKEPPPAQRPSAECLGARGVWVLGPKAETAIPGLIPLLTNKSASVRGCAARALGCVGPKAART